LFSHDSFSKNLINETLSFNAINNKLRKLFNKHYIDDNIYKIMCIKNKFFINYFSHGAYVKNLDFSYLIPINYKNV
jgi:hypothetical protein